MKKIKSIVEARKEFLAGVKFISKAAKKQCLTEKKSMSVFAVDQSLNSTGWAFGSLGARDITKVKTGVVLPSKYGFSRLIDLERRLEEILKDSSPFCVMEGYASNAKWGREVAGEVGGIIKRVFCLRERPLLIIAPLTAKAWVKAKTKDQIMLQILDRYKVKIENNNQADAFILYDIGRCVVSMALVARKEKLRSERDVFNFFKFESYKNQGFPVLDNLFKYQADSLFRIIFSQGRRTPFYLPSFPELKNI